MITTTGTFVSNSNQCVVISSVPSNERCILIDIPYGDALILPMYFIERLTDVKFVTKASYPNKAYNFSNNEPEFALIKYSSIKAALPDPEIKRNKLKEAKEKLIEELSSIEKELDA